MTVNLTFDTLVDAYFDAAEYATYHDEVRSYFAMRRDILASLFGYSLQPRIFDGDDRREASTGRCNRFRKDGVDAVLGDLDRPETLATAIAGIDTLFLVTAPTPAQVAQETAAIDAAERVGVRRIVKVSASDCNVRSRIPWAKSHARIDHHLRASVVDWTILMPTAFMQNFLWFTTPVAKGYLPLGAGKGSVSWVDTRDIARVAVTVLTQEWAQPCDVLPDGAGDLRYEGGRGAAIGSGGPQGAVHRSADALVPHDPARDRKFALDGKRVGRAVLRYGGGAPRHRSDLRDRASHRSATQRFRELPARPSRGVRQRCLSASTARSFFVPEGGQRQHSSDRTRRRSPATARVRSRSRCQNTWPPRIEIRPAPARR